LCVVAAGAWTRTANYAAASVQPLDAFLFISEGTTYADSGWVSVTDGTITVDTTATVWQQFTGGAGLTVIGVLNKTGNTLSLNIGDGLENFSSTLRVMLNGTTLDRSSSGLRIAPIASGQLYVGQGVGVNVAPVVVSGDIALAATGVVTVSTNVATAARLSSGNNITPSGTVDGTNAAFTLANVVQGTLMLYQNGLLQEPGAGNDYTVGGTNAATTVTFLVAPSVGDKLRAYFLPSV